MSWPIYIVVGLSVLALSRRSVRWLRVAAVIVNLGVLGQQCIYLANVGRNTFESVERQQSVADTFHEGVFAEAKTADAFARQQLLAVYLALICLGALAIWPAATRAGAKPEVLVRDR